jgi:ribosomal protein S18 acetylase RimI-like enzyme
MSERGADKAVVIRPYRPQDRAQVREIACDTADRGEPVERLFHDRRTVADVLTCYYSDYEPESLWVAQSGPMVAGYLSGCLNTRRYDRVMLRVILPQAMIGALARGALFRRETWRLVAGFVRTGLAGGRPRIDRDKYPAHLHINLRPDFRGRGIGAQLVERFRQQVRQAGGQGIHLMTLGDNEAGRKFFEAVGFRLVSEWPLYLPEGKRLRRTSTAVYGWTREDSP